MMIAVSILLVLLLLHLVDHFVVAVHSPSLGRWGHHQILLGFRAYFVVIVALLRKHLIILFNKVSVFEQTQHRQNPAETYVQNDHN
jgi:hypothetical protein